MIELCRSSLVASDAVLLKQGANKTRKLTVWQFVANAQGKSASSWKLPSYGELPGYVSCNLASELGKVD